MLTKEEAAHELVKWHYKIDPRMTQALRMFTPRDDDPCEPINFLEVSPDTPASGDVMTFTFGPAGDIPYNMRIATITPEEMEQVRRGEIPLPHEWRLEHSFVYPVPAHWGQEGRRWRRSRESVHLSSVRYGGRKRLPASRMRSRTG